MRDPYTAGHQKHVANLARAIATEMGIPKEKIEGIRMAGAIHDIGKISVPYELLSKPGPLKDVEFDMIKLHSGSGYPQGLSGEEICLEARIMAVADVVDAMSSHRPYRPALGIEKALEEISQNSGTLYDPEAVDACVRLFAEKEFKLK
ncbi:MAG: HD domain-containing protein [Deltaproteobacteria bacterium]|nr:HD domain-containing protein [Deltaproteobacteria bacterium]